MKEIKKAKEWLGRAKRLTDYAVETRYPADLEPVTENEYKTVIKIAEEVFELIDQIIK